jgi:hypothetical protein
LTFEPDEEPGAEPKPRSTFKRAKRKPAGEAPKADPFEEPAAPRKKRTSLAKVVVEGKPWQRWIDPSSVLWLPLPIALAFFVGSALFSLIIPPAANQDGATNISFIFVAFSLILAFVPGAYLLSHWMQIGGNWAQGNTADPPWPDMDMGAILADLINALPALVFATLFSGWILFVDAGPPLVKSALAAWLFVIYFSIGLLAVSLQSHPLASNPVSILLALLRMSRGRWAFLLETSIHLLIGFLLWRAIFLVWEKNWDVGMLVWGALWIFVFFAGARLMRAAGTYYRRNAKRIGWFT